MNSIIDSPHLAPSYPAHRRVSSNCILCVTRCRCTSKKLGMTDVGGLRQHPKKNAGEKEKVNKTSGNHQPSKMPQKKVQKKLGPGRLELPTSGLLRYFHRIIGSYETCALANCAKVPVTLLIVEDWAPP